MRHPILESRHLGTALALALTFPLVQAADPAPVGTKDEITERIVAEQQDRELRVVGLGRVRVSFPQRISGALGAMVVRQPVDYDCRTVCEFRGLYVQAEPGYSGAQISAGYAVVMGETDRSSRFLSRPYLGWGVKGALLRTWDSANLTPSAQTFVGAEGELSIIRINFSLGAFRSVDSGPEPENDWIVAGGMGWGF